MIKNEKDNIKTHNILLKSKVNTYARKTQTLAPNLQTAKIICQITGEKNQMCKNNYDVLVKFKILNSWIAVQCPNKKDNIVL